MGGYPQMTQYDDESCEEQEQTIVNYHRTPELPDALVEALGEKVIGLPEDVEEEHADNLSHQDAHDTEIRSKCNGDGEIEEQLCPRGPHVAIETC